MIQMLTDAPAGTVGPIVETRGVCRSLFDMNFVVDGENNGDGVEIYASGSSQRDDFRLIGTVTVLQGHTTGIDTPEFNALNEGPWERMYAKAIPGNAGHVSCFMQTSG